MIHQKAGQFWISSDSLKFHVAEGRTQAGYYVECACGAELPIGEFPLSIPPRSARFQELWDKLDTSEEVIDSEFRKLAKEYESEKKSYFAWHDKQIADAERDAINKHVEALAGKLQQSGQ